MQIVESIAAMRKAVRQWRLACYSIALVPTMGNLHQGHLTLVKAAQKKADRVVVSIFVNPTQFVEGDDFNAYPRTVEEDQVKLQNINTDLLFLPQAETIYPSGSNTSVTVSGISELYCGAVRVGHFSGVATIVCKLFNMVQPDIALFGEKDWQQLAVIRCMVKDLNMPVQIAGVATVREADGLAMSSRNGYLNNTQRTVAAKLYQSLCKARDLIMSGEKDYKLIEQQQLRFLQNVGFSPDYFSICRGSDLQPATTLDRELVILVAAKLGKARLIDNIQVLLHQEADN